MNAMQALNRARQAWERSQPQLFLEFPESGALRDASPSPGCAPDQSGGGRPSVPMFGGADGESPQHAPRSTADATPGTTAAATTRKD